MDNPLYVRIRGRVLGPYDEDKLRQMARRGQLSRLHELSPDGVNWSPASKYPEVFAGAAAELKPPGPAAMDGRGKEPGMSPSSPPGQGAAPGSYEGARSPEAVWYYSKDGVQGTCAGMAGLQQATSAGIIGPDDPVWTPGMPQWQLARNVPGLAFPAIQPRGRPADGNAEAEVVFAADALPRELCRAAIESRPWVIFLAISAFVYAGLSAVGGMLLLVQGASAHVAPIIASGLFGLVYAAIAITGGMLLMGHASYLGKLGYARTPLVLTRALEAIRRFWVFTSVVLIIMLAFALFVVIWILSIGTSVLSF